MLMRIASKIASSLSEQPDYGSGNAALPRGFDQTSDVEYDETKHEWCVTSPDNPSWSAGCYPDEEDAKNRLRQVEYFKHLNQ